jgi:hypothetical protein
LVAALLVLALGGCGDGPEAVPATVPVPATGGAEPVPSDVAGLASRRAGPGRTPPGAAGEGPAGFAAAVQSELPELVVDHRDEEIVALGEQACSGLAAGRSAGAVVAEVRTFGTGPVTGDSALTAASARRLVRLAIPTVCPDQDRRINEF